MMRMAVPRRNPWLPQTFQAWLSLPSARAILRQPSVDSYTDLIARNGVPLATDAPYLGTYRRRSLFSM